MMRLFHELKRIPALSGVVEAAELARLINRRNQLWSEVNRLKKEREHEEYFPPHIADAINLLRNEKNQGLGNTELVQR